MKNRYVIVGIDKRTGDLYISTEMLHDEYYKDEAEKIVEQFNTTMKELRDYIVMPWDQAVCLWAQVRSSHEKQTNQTTH